MSGVPFESLGVAVSCTAPPMNTFGVAGLTTTDATGRLATLIAAAALIPSLVAVIVVDPAAMPVTSPAADTVAMAGLALVHVTARPVSTVPAASLGVALSCAVPATDILTEVGLTTTEATGTLDTVTAAVPLWPSLVAVIVATPTATLVTSPLAEIAATALLLVVHVTTRPMSGVPFASLGVAVSCTAPPMNTFGVAGLTTTDATGRLATLIAAAALIPSLVAVIVVDPTAMPVTSPAADTVAMAGLALVHVTARPVSTVPAASLGVALSCAVPATDILTEVGLTTTEATGTL